jgi:hypothetical protein
VIKLTLYCVSVSAKQLFTAASNQSQQYLPTTATKKLAEVKNLKTYGCKIVWWLSVLNFIHEYLIHI